MFIISGRTLGMLAALACAAILVYAFGGGVAPRNETAEHLVLDAQVLDQAGQASLEYSM